MHEELDGDEGKASRGAKRSERVNVSSRYEMKQFFNRTCSLNVKSWMYEVISLKIKSCLQHRCFSPRSMVEI